MRTEASSEHRAKEPEPSASTGGQPEETGAPSGTDAAGKAGCGAASDERLLRIGQLAERSGKTTRALHLYEEMGLLRPSLRSKGGFRLYAPSAVERVQWISRLQEADVSLGEIQTLLKDLEGARIGTAAMRRLGEMLKKKLDEVREQRRKLEQLESDLVAGLEYIAGCHVCEPEHLTSECGECRLHGHDGRQPLLVAGAQNS